MDPLLTGVEPLVRFDKVVKRYGDHVVLDELDFSVRRGEHVTLIGPSGSGKTTILRLLMTLEKVSDGVIWVDGSPSRTYAGRTVRSSPRARRNCAGPGRRSGWSSSSSISSRT